MGRRYPRKLAFAPYGPPKPSFTWGFSREYFSSIAPGFARFPCVSLLGAWTWEPGPGSLDLGAWTWEPGPGSLDLGAWTWEPGPGSLGVIKPPMISTSPAAESAAWTLLQPRFARTTTENRRAARYKPLVDRPRRQDRAPYPGAPTSTLPSLSMREGTIPLVAFIDAVGERLGLCLPWSLSVSRRAADPSFFPLHFLLDNLPVRL